MRPTAPGAGGPRSPSRSGAPTPATAPTMPATSAPPRPGCAPRPPSGSPCPPPPTTTRGAAPATNGSPRSDDVLDLTFTPEQEMLRDVVRGVCAEHAPPSVVRDMEDDPHGFPPELWKQLAQLDLLGL